MGFDDACLECHAYVTVGNRSARPSFAQHSLSSVQSPASFLHRSRVRPFSIPSPCPTTPAYRHASPPTPLALMSYRIPPQALHKSTPAFSPAIPTALLPYLAFFLLSATFALAFYFSTYVSASLSYPTHALTSMPLFATVCRKRRFPRGSSPWLRRQAFWAGSGL